MPEVCWKWLRCVPGSYRVAKLCPSWVKGVLEVLEVCSRSLRFALGQYEVAGVGLSWLRLTEVRYAVAKVCPRWSLGVVRCV
jgi:hypothetical protein